MEAIEEAPKKTKLFFINAVEHWNAEFYVRVNDDVFVNIGMLIMSNLNYLNLVEKCTVCVEWTYLQLHFSKC